MASLRLNQEIKVISKLGRRGCHSAAITSLGSSNRKDLNLGRVLSHKCEI